MFRSIDSLGEEEVSALWMCRGIAAKGYLTLFASKPKGGKSTFTFAMLAAAERGEPVAGLATSPTIAVYLSEEPPRTIRQKADRFGLSRALFLTRRDAFPRRSLREFVENGTTKAHEIGAEVLVIDTMTFWASLPEDAEKDAGAMQAAVDHLLRAAATGLAVLVLHHTRKAPGEDIDTVRGSNALTAAADIIVTFKRSGDDPAQRTLRVFGRDEECPPRVVIRLCQSGYENVEPKEARQDLRQSVLNVLPDPPHDGLKRDEVRELLQARAEFVKKVLDDLYEEGLVGRTGTGKRGRPYRYRRLISESRSRSAPQVQDVGTETEEDSEESEDRKEGALQEEGDSVPDDLTLRGGTGTESHEAGEETVTEGQPEPDPVSVPVPVPRMGTELLDRLVPVPWYGYSSDLWALWDDLWSRWQERAAILEFGAGLPRKEAERRAWEEVAP